MTAPNPENIRDMDPAEAEAYNRIVLSLLVFKRPHIALAILCNLATSLAKHLGMPQEVFLAAVDETWKGRELMDAQERKADG